ncbi:MAG TPA: response regulator [Anaeromyxobacteraceae bacterium]|nr:response regulator [Anaeromyxobacteraceae bacterium]
MSDATGLVLVVEDEPQMRRFLRASLGAEGYRVREAWTVADGLREIAAEHPDAVLLDLGLPDGDGLDLLRRVREWSQVPVIVVSARGREEEKVAALDAGADDYLAKPFGTKELLARLRVALRHARAGTGPEEAVIQAGALRLDLERREASVDGRAVRLTPIEWRLLALLARHAGKVLTHAQILREVWGPNAAAQTHYVRVFMAELRRKIEADPSRPRLLLTEPGVGYRLADAPGPAPGTGGGGAR